MIRKEDGKWCLYTKDGLRKLGHHDTKKEAEAQERAVHAPQQRHAVSFRGAISGAMRTATFEDREYLVVPVVAMVEGVIHAVNSATPELVLAEEFSKVPDGWNGRPVLWDHPSLNGHRVSANEPIVLEKMAFGQVFHTEVSSTKLLMEAWLDLEKAGQLATARKVLERLRGGETVEVSVGAFVETEERSGERDGKRYQGVWRNIVPDHLALLPEGTAGACDVGMGCGAPRAASDQEDKKMTLTERVRKLVAGFKPSQDGQSDADLRERLSVELYATEPGFLGIDAVFPDENLVIYGAAPDGETLLFRRSYSTDDAGVVTLADDKQQVALVRRYEPVTAAEGLSDNDIREALRVALLEVEGGADNWVWVEAVFDSAVVYTAKDADGVEQYYEKDYTISSTGAVTLGEERREMKRVVTYEAASKRHQLSFEKVSAAPSGRGSQASGSAPARVKEMDMTKKERVAAIIATGKTCFKVEDAAYMEEKLPDERLTALEQHIETVKVAEADVKQKEAKAAEAKVVEAKAKEVKAAEEKKEAEVKAAAAAAAGAKTPEQEEDDFLNTHPALNKVVTGAKAAEVVKKDELVSRLKDAAKAGYTEDELKALSIEGLEKLAATILKPRADFTTAGGPRVQESDDEQVPKPIDMATRIIEARKGGQQKSA